MPKVPQSDHLPFEMEQERSYTCIPTNIAAILHSAGITEATDPSDGVQPISGEFVKELYFQVTISFDALEKSELFPTPSKPGKLSDFHGCRIHAEGGFGSFGKWWAAVYEHISQGSYVVLSISAPAPHAVTVYEIDGDSVKVYNPDRNGARSYLMSQLERMWLTPVGQARRGAPRLNHDILVVRIPNRSAMVSVGLEEGVPST